MKRFGHAQKGATTIADPKRSDYLDQKLNVFGWAGNGINTKIVCIDPRKSFRIIVKSQFRLIRFSKS